MFPISTRSPPPKRPPGGAGAGGGAVATPPNGSVTTPLAYRPAVALLPDRGSRRRFKPSCPARPSPPPEPAWTGGSGTGCGVPASLLSRGTAPRAVVTSSRRNTAVPPSVATATVGAVQAAPEGPVPVLATRPPRSNDNPNFAARLGAPVRGSATKVGGVPILDFGAINDPPVE